uniref:RING-type domain-containing protein n=1 Tax=Neolamprologus brichardi TaxID=32507 RepID=A0A3Q4I7G0_NEOBR
MESQPEANLKCPICLEIFQDPVILWCSHGFCLQRWWTETSVTCPICRTTFLQGDPPQNLALKNLCEAYLLQTAQGKSDTLLCGRS